MLRRTSCPKIVPVRSFWATGCAFLEHVAVTANPAVDAEEYIIQCLLGYECCGDTHTAPYGSCAYVAAHAGQLRAGQLLLRNVLPERH